MAYFNVTSTIPANILQGTIDPGLTTVTGMFSLPPVAAVNLLFGTGAGKINILASAGGTATASPATINLAALLDPFGTSKDLTTGPGRVRQILILNKSTTDANFLLLDGTVTNGWLSPFNSIATSKLKIHPGYTDPSGNVIPGMVLLSAPNTTAYVAGASNRVISLDPGANTIPYAVYLLGCDA